MDRVTQANAGNAEETAAAAEELNAQTVVQREAVAELLALVGRTASHSAAPVATSTMPFAHTASAVKKPSLAKKPAHSTAGAHEGQFLDS
jgi:methyl-accepting chemotaxis protein